MKATIRTPASMRSIGSVFAALMLAAGSVQAASISYILDQSNVLVDGVPYLQVTVSDGANGAIDFTVQTLGILNSHAGSNFGIQAFAFNVVSSGSADGSDIANLPSGWKVRDNFRMSEFGFFDIKVYGTGKDRIQTLTFSILGVDGDKPQDYAVLSSGKGANKQFFAAHVADFTDPKCTKKKCSTTSGFFAGGTPAVPLPGAAWLFATGAATVAARARRRRAG